MHEQTTLKPRISKQRIEDMKSIAQKHREIVEEEELEQEASDLPPIFVHLYKQHLG